MATDTSILDGNVEEVKTSLSGQSQDALRDLLAAEQAGKNRKGVIDAIQMAQTDDATSGDVSGAETALADPAVASASEDRLNDDGSITAPHPATAGEIDTSGPADIPAATEFEASGAPLQVTPVDLTHPAIDANPRERTTVDMNRIDFNDPTREGSEIVTERMQEQRQG